MNTINTLRQDTRKIFTSYGFWLSTILTTLLLFSTCIYKDETNNALSVIGVLINYNKTFLLNNIEFCSMVVFKKSSSSTLDIFIPIIAALPYIPLFLDERNSGLIRSCIYRTGKLRYYLSKFVSSLIGGGCAIALGYMIFGVLIFFLFPSKNEYSVNLSQMYDCVITNCGSSSLTSIYNKFGEIAIIIPQILSMFLYGAIATLPAFILSSLLRNKYLLMCIPFILKYMYDQIILKLSINPNTFINQHGLKAIMVKYFSTDCLKSYLLSGDRILVLTIINIFILLFSFLIFSFFMNRRVDLGA